MATTFDTIIIGGGTAGAAAFDALARRGQRVLCLERDTSPNTTSSHHGLTRIIRLAYFEHPSYVPLLRRAYALWADLAAAAGAPLFHRTGILEIGRPDEMLVAGVRQAAAEHGIAHEVLSASATMRRFPVWHLPADFVAVHQADGGYLIPEAAIAALVARGRAHGGVLIEQARVTGLVPQAGHVTVRTDQARYEAGSVIVAAGAWLPQLVPDLAAHLTVERRVLGWFAPRDPAAFAPERFPVFILQDGGDFWYGFPTHGTPTVKVAHHWHGRVAVDPDRFDRTAFSPADEGLIRPVLTRFLPGADGPLTDMAACLYTMTANEHFILDTLPADPRIVIASPCSGHGFKFAPVTGEILADLATHGTTRHDIGLFRLAAHC
jgi:sarcosine oxidase